MTIETLREEPGRPLGQLPITSRGGQRGASDVPAYVELGVILPFGPRQPARVWLRQALPIARQLLEPALEVLTHLLERRHGTARLGIKDQHRPGVHVRALVDLLELEERPVQRCQMLGHEKDQPHHTRQTFASTVAACSPTTLFVLAPSG